MALCIFMPAGDGVSVCEVCGGLEWIPDGITVESVCSGRNDKRPRNYLAAPMPAVLPAASPCRHLGESLRLEPCKPCEAAGGRLEIFACDRFGECVRNAAGKRKPDGARWPACSTCADYLPAAGT